MMSINLKARKVGIKLGLLAVAIVLGVFLSTLMSSIFSNRDTLKAHIATNCEASLDVVKHTMTEPLEQETTIQNTTDKTDPKETTTSQPTTKANVVDKQKNIKQTEITEPTTRVSVTSADNDKTKNPNDSMTFVGTFEATAYCGDTITSTGTVPVTGRTIAVDPNIIPYGTKVYLDAGAYSGYYIAEDCGGAINGYIIDIFMNSYDECRQWGRRNINLYIVN